MAFIVQSGRTLSSTVLNNLASTWDSTIYPTMTTYYGKDYQDGRGLAPPDIDNNCQVQIIIYDIDGAYNTGGYFAPSFSSSREAVFVDYADITLSWGRSILAHELEHLLHNALDPYENLWIDEGNADVAIYLCFGADSTLTGHVNAWTGAPEQSVRWWNQRIADYGAGYMFTMYLAEHLGGGPAVRQLVQDSATGGRGVENLLLSPQSGQVGLLGRTMNEAFANFSIAATLDSDQGIYGYPNLDLNPVCTGGAFCRAQPTEVNSDWSTPWSSTGNTLEGWGIRSFQFTPGAASPAPLTLRLTADKSQFDGVIVYQGRFGRSVERHRPELRQQRGHGPCARVWQPHRRSVGDHLVCFHRSGLRLHLVRPLLSRRHRRHRGCPNHFACHALAQQHGALGPGR